MRSRPPLPRRQLLRAPRRPSDTSDLHDLIHIARKIAPKTDARAGPLPSALCLPPPQPNPIQPLSPPLSRTRPPFFSPHRAAPLERIEKDGQRQRPRCRAGAFFGSSSPTSTAATETGTCEDAGAAGPVGVGGGGAVRGHRVRLLGVLPSLLRLVRVARHLVHCAWVLLCVHLIFGVNVRQSVKIVFRTSVLKAFCVFFRPHCTGCNVCPGAPRRPSVLVIGYFISMP